MNYQMNRTIEAKLRSRRRWLRFFGMREKAELIEQVLADQDMLDCLCDAINAQATNNLLFGYGNPVIDVLNWIKDNWDWIMEAIQDIIDLFMSERAELEALRTN